MDRHVLRGIDADTHLVALHAENGNGHLVTDHQGFTDPAGQNQHVVLLHYAVWSQACCRWSFTPELPVSQFDESPSKALPPSPAYSKTFAMNALASRRHRGSMPP